MNIAVCMLLSHSDVQYVTAVCLYSYTLLGDYNRVLKIFLGSWKVPEYTLGKTVETVVNCYCVTQ